MSPSTTNLLRDGIHPALNGINAGRSIRFVLYSISESTENQIKRALSAMLERYEKTDLLDSLYTVLFEVIVNAFRANLKQVYFHERGLDLHKPDEYAEGMKTFRDFFRREIIKEYRQKMRQSGIRVSVRFIHSDVGLRIEVENNVEILPVEERRIRDRLREAKKYDDLFDFYSANADSEEGQGLGLVLATLVLKSEGIDPGLFRIGSKEGKTLARIEIPFTNEFQSVRHVSKRRL